MTTRACPICGKPLERRPGEQQRDFDKRLTCNASCAGTHRSNQLRAKRGLPHTVARGQVRAAIIQLATDLTAITFDDVVDEIHVPRGTARTALAALVRDGTLEVRRGDRQRLYALPEKPVVDRRAA